MPFSQCKIMEIFALAMFKALGHSVGPLALFRDTLIIFVSHAHQSAVSHNVQYTVSTVSTYCITSLQSSPLHCFSPSSSSSSSSSPVFHPSSHSSSSYSSPKPPHPSICAVLENPGMAKTPQITGVTSNLTGVIVRVLLIPTQRAASPMKPGGRSLPRLG